jgi:hypothetical protein
MGKKTQNHKDAPPTVVAVVVDLSTLGVERDGREVSSRHLPAVKFPKPCYAVKIPLKSIR